MLRSERRRAPWTTELLALLSLTSSESTYSPGCRTAGAGAVQACHGRHSRLVLPISFWSVLSRHCSLPCTGWTKREILATASCGLLGPIGSDDQLCILRSRTRLAYIRGHLPQPRQQPLIGPVELESFTRIIGQCSQNDQGPQLPVYIPILELLSQSPRCFLLISMCSL
jgi:hypothetical protein